MSDKICVLVFTCSRPEDLKRCLDSLLRQTHKGFEVTVINNGDDPQTAGILKDRGLKVIEDRTKRLSYLFNLGWKSATGEFIAFLADDVEVDPDWLKEGADSLRRNAHAAVATGPLVSPFEFSGEMHVLYSQGIKNPLLRHLTGFYNNFVMEGKLFEPCVLCESGAYTMGQAFEPQFSQEREVDLATTSAMLLRRSAVESIDGFDENFMFNHADGDLFIRLKKKGYRIIYNPRMKGKHYNRLGPSRKPFFIGRDTAYFYLKDVRPRSVKGLFACAVNICVLNLYWIYKTARTGNAKQLLGIAGFVRGIFDYIVFKAVRPSGRIR